MVYHMLVILRLALYRRAWLQITQLPVPIVVVGNVVAGGTGKTPVVIALVEHLQGRGIQVGVISRGYGRSQMGCMEVTRTSTAQDVGDEPALIHRRTGVAMFVAERRVDAALALLAQHPNTQLVLSDDGLQHLQMARDLEIGVFDDRGVGNGFLLPAGPLREPWPRPLDLVLHTGTQPAFAGFRAQRTLAKHALCADGSRVSLADLQAPGQAPLLALAAIAQPEAFFAMLRAQGLHLARTLALPDHFNFDSYSCTEYGGYRVICTEKDAIKLWPLQPDALAVPLLCELPDVFWVAFDAQLDRLLSRAQRAPPNGSSSK
jgi:tetraacyldisaccharide 4'-kinase